MPTKISGTARTIGTAILARRRRQRGERRIRIAHHCAHRSNVSIEGSDDRLGDDFHRPPGNLARLAQTRERLLLCEALSLHEEPLRTLDRLARGERFAERVGLLA